jgi:hypothetical protein
MKEPKRRYTSPNQIEAEIDQAKQKASDLLRTADSLEAIAKEHSKLADSGEVFYREQGIEERQKADRARITATNILDGKVVELTHKLAELNTPPLNGIIQDASVEA